MHLAAVLLYYASQGFIWQLIRVNRTKKSVHSILIFFALHELKILLVWLPLLILIHIILNRFKKRKCIIFRVPHDQPSAVTDKPVFWE